jgi:hypothetical protein
MISLISHSYGAGIIILSNSQAILIPHRLRWIATYISIFKLFFLINKIVNCSTEQTNSAWPFSIHRFGGEKIIYHLSDRLTAYDKRGLRGPLLNIEQGTRNFE